MAEDGLPIEDVWHHLEQLGPERLRQEVAGRFLLRLVQTHPAASASATIADFHERQGEGSWRCHPIVRKSTSPYRLVSIGRTHNNDIVIADASVSKFHAYFRSASDLRVWDGNSKNGTKVNDVVVPSRDDGEPIAMNVGDVLKVGSVPLTLVDVDGLMDLRTTLGHDSAGARLSRLNTPNITFGSCDVYQVRITAGRDATVAEVEHILRNCGALPSTGVAAHVLIDLSALGDQGLQAGPQLYAAAAALFTNVDVSGLQVHLLASTQMAAMACSSLLQLIGIPTTVDVLHSRPSPFEVPSTQAGEG